MAASVLGTPSRQNICLHQQYHCEDSGITRQLNFTDVVKSRRNTVISTVLHCLIHHCNFGVCLTTEQDLFPLPLNLDSELREVCANSMWLISISSLVEFRVLRSTLLCVYEDVSREA